MTDTTQAPVRIWLPKNYNSTDIDCFYEISTDDNGTGKAYVRADLAPEMAAIVKSLEWRVVDEMDTGPAYSDGNDLYTVFKSPKNGDWVVYPRNGKISGRYGDAEQAFAAAQADYEKSVLSAMTIRSADDVRREALEEAAVAMQPHLRSMLSRGQATRLIHALCDTNPAESDTQGHLSISESAQSILDKLSESPINRDAQLKFANAACRADEAYQGYPINDGDAARYAMATAFLRALAQKEGA